MKSTITTATIRFAAAFKAIGTAFVASIFAGRWGSSWRYVVGGSQGVEVRHGLLRQRWADHRSAGSSLALRLASAMGLLAPAMACRPASPSSGDSSSNRSSAVA